METCEMNTYEGMPTWEMRFLTTCESVASVWVLNAFLRPGNDRAFHMYNDKGLIIQDRAGQYWMICRETYNTPEQARRAAGTAGLDYAGNAIVVIDLTQTTCDNDTCKCCY